MENQPEKSRFPAVLSGPRLEVGTGPRITLGNQHPISGPQAIYDAGTVPVPGLRRYAANYCEYKETYLREAQGAPAERLP